MGKITFRPLVQVLNRTKAVAVLPVLGSIIFAAGSAAFWPSFVFTQEGNSAANIGATLFVFGSIFFFVAPVLDYLDMTYSAYDLRESAELATEADKKYKALYKAQLIRTTRVNAILYSVSGVCFIAGSILFYPGLWLMTTHGAWLFVMGSVINVLAAALATASALDMRKMAPVEVQFDSTRIMDETFTVASCLLYIVGDCTFTVGSVLFFPVMMEGGRLRPILFKTVVEMGAINYKAAIGLFIVGSIIFMVGSLIDLYVVLRDKKGRSTPTSPTIKITSGASPSEKTGLICS